MNKVLFMIINNEVRFNMDSNIDHKEWYTSLGFSMDLFETIVRGFVMNNRIIFYKGSTFNYDEEVIKAAKMYTPYIRFTLQNQTLEPYCGISFTNPTNWEPILKIQENEITGIPTSTPKKEKKETVEVGPLLEIKNNYEDEKFIKTAIIVTGIVLGITIVMKIILMSQKGGLSLGNLSDGLLILSQVGLLSITIYGHIKRQTFAKYTGLVASILLIFTFHIVDVIVGILYFLFCVDYHYYIKLIQIIKKKNNTPKQ